MSETWIGGRFELDVDESWDEDDDEPAPHVVLWIQERSRAVLALVAVPSDEPPEATAVILEAAMREPDFGDPRRPERVRVESPELAAFLIERFPDLTIVQAPTPEVEEALQEIYASMGGEAPAEDN